MPAPGRERQEHPKFKVMFNNVSSRLAGDVWDPSGSASEFALEFRVYNLFGEADSYLSVILGELEFFAYTFYNLLSQFGSNLPFFGL